jgi:hypothetical protein
LSTRPNKAWKKKGERCIIKNKFNRSNKYSYALAISKTKIIGRELIEKSFNTQKFNSFMEEKVIPNINNKAVLMDGASIHKSLILAKKLKDKNIDKIINVPYSPQYNLFLWKSKDQSKKYLVY